MRAVGRKVAILIAVLATVVLVGWYAGLGQQPASKSVYLVQTPTASVHVMLVLPQDQPVLAHYAEHLTWMPNMGRGARPEDRDSNAWTNQFANAYWLSGPVEDLPAMLAQFKVVFDPINLPRAFAEQERDIILREYELRMGNNPDAQMSEQQNAFLYQGNALAVSVIGTPENIKALDYEAARAFHTATYRPERARLVVTGGVSDRQLYAAMKRAGLPDLDLNREDVAPPPFTLAAPDNQTLRDPLATAAPRMIWRKVVRLPAPVDFDLLETQTALTRAILDTNLPGGIAGPLRFDQFIAKTYAITLTAINESHIELFFAAEPDKGVSFAALQAGFEAALAASAQGVPQATVDRVKTRFGDYWPDWSDSAAYAEWMAFYTQGRVAALREPKTEAQMRSIAAEIDAEFDATTAQPLLQALAGPGRTSIGFIGTDPAP